MQLSNLSASTLMVGRNESNCNNCGKNASPNDESHDWTYGYDPGPGCGIKFTHSYSKYMGDNAAEAVRNLRPDLEFIEITL